MTTPHHAWQSPMPPRRRHNPALIILLVVIGSFALLFAGCGVLVAVAAHSGPDSAAPKHAYAMREAAQDGKFTFVVTGMRRTDHIGDSVIGQDAQGEFVVLDVTVMNHGNQPQMLNASNQHLIANGKTYDATADITSDAFLSNINPGNSVQATIAFDVPAGANVTQVVFHDSAFSNGVRVKLSSDGDATPSSSGW